MTPAHHPREETLAAYASGVLAPGPRLVVATHLAGCRACREAVRVCEGAGGALLDMEPPASMPPDFLARTLARRDQLAAAPAPRRQTEIKVPPDLAWAPSALLECEIGPWRFVQPGLRMSRVKVPGEPKANVVLLKFSAGRPAPQHGHSGIEYTQVLRGAFSDSMGRYVAGDCIEADTEIDHQPAVVGEEDCICLSAVEGKLKLHSWMARLVQPLLGI